jgi:hypothetical protein
MRSFFWLVRAGVPFSVENAVRFYRRLIFIRMYNVNRLRTTAQGTLFLFRRRLITVLNKMNSIKK